MRIIPGLLILLSFILFTHAQQNHYTEPHSTDVNYPATLIPTDTTRLWIADGNTKSDTVLVICQGGPTDVLTYAKKGRTNYRYIPGYSNYNIVYVHQAQTINPTMFSYANDFILNMAKSETEKSIEFLFRTIEYFKNRKKTVIVIGNSYGAYLIANYLANRTDRADKYYAIAGRIDDNLQILEQHTRGFNGSFKEDGHTYIPEDEKADLSSYSVAKQKAYRVKQLLKAAIGTPRYSQTIKQKDLTKLTYFYAKNDTHVGRLSSDEIAFLKNRGATVYATDSGHSETLYRFIDKLMDKSLKL